MIALFGKRLLVGIFLISLISSTSLPSWADSILLKNGEVIEGGIREVIGELVYVKNHFRRPYKVNRTDIVNRRDVVTMRSGETIEGQIIYATPYRWEIHTDKGTIKVWRFMVKNAKLGAGS